MLYALAFIIGFIPGWIACWFWIENLPTGRP
jgi:hypothetical protein